MIWVQRKGIGWNMPRLCKIISDFIKLLLWWKRLCSLSTRGVSFTQSSQLHAGRVTVEIWWLHPKLMEIEVITPSLPPTLRKPQQQPSNKMECFALYFLVHCGFQVKLYYNNFWNSVRKASLLLENYMSCHGETGLVVDTAAAGEEKAEKKAAWMNEEIN